MDPREFEVGRGLVVNLETDDCVPWPLHVAGNGYGAKSDRSKPSRIQPAHRWVYEKAVGPIPDGLHLDHLCGRRDCVNPRHLEPVTPGVNNARARLGRSLPLLCKNGRPADWHFLPDGKRRCRTCVRERAARYRATNGAHIRAYKKQWATDRKEVDVNGKDCSR